MPTFSASGLSAEAKEFVPLHPNPPANTIPLYIDGNTIASIYTIAPQEQTPLMYPPIREIEFRISPTVNDNPPPLVLFPAPGCYPGTAITSFYPMEYPEPSMISYPLSPAKSNQSSRLRPQRGSNNQPMNRKSHPTSSKSAAKIIQTRFPAQKKENTPAIKRTDQNSFQIRPEDFPGLSTSQPQSTPVSIDTKFVEKLASKFREILSCTLLVPQQPPGVPSFPDHDLCPHLHLVRNELIKAYHQRRKPFLLPNNNNNSSVLNLQRRPKPQRKHRKNVRKRHRRKTRNHPFRPFLHKRQPLNRFHFR